MFLLNRNAHMVLFSKIQIKCENLVTKLLFRPVY